ncbi:hypothetical protein [Bdellovibrio svalbardensis]|uniref:Uncharacterized protein n=1 Tax=Bdellovibrio svalbardensis TaxID=2972972 RepID=A0ABT6DSP1_9BACT|nr:hypothetical protein [Bdellovibrio svalbardensis]MDG0818163.1 hypothetical protein [Bdellovibrio svalbardensis]
MKLFAALTLLFLSLWNWSALATTAWQKTAVPVVEGSDLQKQIDGITVEIFQNSKSKILCGIFNDPVSAVHSLGISLPTAKRIYENCPRSSAEGTAKIMAKKYYVSFLSQNGLDSWTDYGNRTYIFADTSLNREKLKSIIIHEMAIATDAKTNMLLSTYLTYRNKEHSEVSNGLQIITMGNLSAREEALKQAFNSSTWKPVSLTFATLRAFNFEKYLNNEEFNTNSHSSCVAEFKSLLKTIKSIPEVPASEDVDRMAEMIANMTSEASAPKSPEQEKQLIDFLMSQDLQLQDQQDNKMTFCQFMTRPLLTGRSLYSFFGSGPRPRLTGGSGGQGKIILDSQKPGAQWLTTEVRKEVSFDKEALKKDQVQEAVEKLKQLIQQDQELKKLQGAQQ